MNVHMIPDHTTLATLMIVLVTTTDILLEAGMMIGMITLRFFVLNIVVK
jgi:hypothetical protein